MFAVGVLLQGQGGARAAPIFVTPRKTAKLLRLVKLIFSLASYFDLTNNKQS
jgi:hypothetical protein